ncbi:MAG: hypothetical protein IJQ93_07875, partial [Bacteroidales bacterium]|nr:hypothetical protein [Bacteroidales bacterium]
MAYFLSAVYLTYKLSIQTPNLEKRSMVGGGSRENKKTATKIDNFTPNVLGIWKNLPIFAS